jgi:hypothetical protein
VVVASKVNEEKRMSSFDDVNNVTLQGDAILPSQFYGSSRGGKRIEAEKRLMSAVLDDGVRCFERNLKARSAQGRRAFLEAEYWLFKERNVGAFSFENVCDALGLSPDCVRRAVWSRRSRTARRRTQGPVATIAGDVASAISNERHRDRLQIARHGEWI